VVYIPFLDWKHGAVASEALVALSSEWTSSIGEDWVPFEERVSLLEIVAMAYAVEDLEAELDQKPLH
jgi:hypothetical protein